MYKMIEKDMYGEIYLPFDIFNKLDSSLFISNCTNTIKYMLANNKETIYLKSLNIDINNCVCDYYKIILI